MMMKSEKEARQACADLIDRLINLQKENISGLEIMKEHINDMTTEQFEHFGSSFAIVMTPEMLHRTMKAHSAIYAVNDTIVHIKEKEAE